MNIIEKVFDLMIDGCMVLNIKGDIIAVNKAYSKMSGYSEDELLKMNLKELEGLQNESQIQDEIKEVIEGGTVQFESVHKKKNGETFIIEVNVTSGNENGELYLISTIRDITNKKITEDQLKTSDKFFNCSLDMLCIAGFDGYFKVLNPAWEKTLGWSTEELLSKPWIEFVYHEDKNSTDNIKTVIVDGQKVYQFENRYVCKNGEIKWLSWNSFPYVEENIMFGVARDITANKHLEESLRESENSYRLLFENMEEAFAVHKIIYDSNQSPIDYIFLDINPFFENFTGLKREDIIGKRVREVLPDTEKFWIETYGKVAITGIAINFENYSKALDKYYKCHAFSPKKDFFAVLFTDITEQKKNEFELIKAKNEAEKASRIKSDFLSNMSHELRTPMNGILGFVDILIETEYDDEKKEYLETVKECSKQMLNMVNDVLCLSKIESGKYLYTEKLINIYSVMERLMNFYKEQAKAKGLNFYFEFDDTLKKDVLMDEKMLLQIVTNLMSNSIKFTHKGFILLSVKKLTDNKFEITVKDTGIGINKEKQNRLFEPFDQGEYYLTKSYGGTGLGLSIVSKLVEILEGVITVETEDGKGTQFKIILPFKNSKVDEENQTETINNRKIKNSIKIISAEDVEINQKLLERMFKDKNWELKKVYNGKELIEKLDTERYDIILMDIQMPEMNGLEATKIIRNNKKYEDIPIIGLSAYALEEDVEKALNMGMNDYLSKPFKKEELIGKIERFCSL